MTIRYKTFEFENVLKIKPLVVVVVVEVVVRS